MAALSGRRRLGEIGDTVAVIAAVLCMNILLSAANIVQCNRCYMARRKVVVLSKSSAQDGRRMKPGPMLGTAGLHQP